MTSFTLEQAEAKRAEVKAAYLALGPLLRPSHRVQAAYHALGAALEDADPMVTELETQAFGAVIRPLDGDPKS
jgi:hypothetical protein